LPYYVTDNSKVERTFTWSPSKTPRDIASDIHAWLQANHDLVSTIFV
jgi:hypothetical protein